MRRLLVLAFIWGWSFLFIKVAVEGMPPVAVAGGRIALGAAVLVGVCAASGLRLKGRLAKVADSLERPAPQGDQHPRSRGCAG